MITDADLQHAIGVLELNKTHLIKKVKDIDGNIILLNKNKSSKLEAKYKNANTYAELNEFFKIKTGFDFGNEYDFIHKYLMRMVIKSYPTFDKFVLVDIVSDQMLESLQKILMYDFNKSNYLTWMVTCCKNLYLQMYKKYGSKFELMDNFRDYEDVYQYEMFELDYNEKISQLRFDKSLYIKEFIIPKLSPNYKTALYKREVERLSYDQIAIDMSLNLNTAKSRIKNARHMVSKMTKEKYNKELIKIDYINYK